MNIGIEYEKILCSILGSNAFQANKPLFVSCGHSHPYCIFIYLIVGLQLCSI